MKPTVISNEYLTLQSTISNKQTEWTTKVSQSIASEMKLITNKQIPIIAQVNLSIDLENYKEWIYELADYLVEQNEEIKGEVEKLKVILSEAMLNRWVEEVLSFNQLYFHTIAKKHAIIPWLPQLLAEHCLRPYLRVVSETYKAELSSMNTKGSCPCCGEPVRLAVLEAKGKKIMSCPRCEAKWQQNRLHCSFCGNDDHEKLSYFNVENDRSSKLEVCSECNGYIKVIDTRKLFKKQSVFLLDVTSLHLDFVAQENGFGETNSEAKMEN